MWQKFTQIFTICLTLSKQCHFHAVNRVGFSFQSNSAQWSKNIVRAIVYPEPLLIQFGSQVELEQWYELFNQTKKRAQMDQGALSKRKSSIIEARLSSNVVQDSSTSTELFIYDIPAHLDVAIALKDYDACFNYLQQAENFFSDNQSMMEAPLSNPNSPMGKLFTSIQENKVSKNDHSLPNAAVEFQMLMRVQSLLLN